MSKLTITKAVRIVSEAAEVCSKNKLVYYKGNLGLKKVGILDFLKNHGYRIINCK